ncbi:MAG: hypothetical protein ABSF28_22515 [Terracidiphilus sp.]|jgi:hypothetical protein
MKRAFAFAVFITLSSVNGATVANFGTAQTVAAVVNSGISTTQGTLKQDARLCNDVVTTQSGAAITSTCAHFSSGDVGKIIILYPAHTGRTFTGTLASVQSATAAMLDAPYPATSAKGLTMILGTDDGAAFNTLITSQIPSNSAKGRLLLGCKPIITTTTLLIAGGRGTQLEGCGMSSGVSAVPGSGSTSGTTIIWAGAAKPIASLSETGNTVTMVVTSGHGFSGTNCARKYRECLVDVEGATPSEFNGTHLILSVPNSTQLTYYAATAGLGTGSGGYLPAQDVIRIQNCYGCAIHDLNIMGSDQPSTKPRSLVDLNDTGAGPYPNSFNKLYNLYLGNQTGVGGLPGSAKLSDSTAQFAILSDPAAVQNDRNNVDNVHVFNVDACFAAEHSQPVDWTFSGTIGCYFSGVSFVMLDGNWWHVSGTLENLQNGVDFLLGTGAHLDVANYNEETDGPSRVYAPQIGGPADVAGTSMFAEFLSNLSSGVPGGILSIDHGMYPASSALPANGDFIWSNGAGDSINLNDFTLTSGQLAPPSTVPIVDFSATGGSAHNTFICHSCIGFEKQNFDVAVSKTTAQQLTYIENDAPAGQGMGEHGVNWLQNGDAAGVDDFRVDFPGKIRVLGGPLTVTQLVSPAYAWGFSCSTSGKTTYYYKITSKSGAGESVPVGEYAVRNCADSVSKTNTITAHFYGVVGADSYKFYRSAAGGEPGSERYALTVPANTGYNTNAPDKGNPDTFRDSIPDGSLGGAPPATNTTGGAIIAGSIANSRGVLIPETAASFAGTSTGGPELALSGTTETITGTSLSGSCDSGTADVPGAVPGHPVAVSSTTGADVGAGFSLRASVTSKGKVTVYICGTGKPPSLAYNVTVF